MSPKFFVANERERVYSRHFFSTYWYLFKGEFRLLTDPFNFDVNKDSPNFQLELIELTSNLHYLNDFVNFYIIKFYYSLDYQTFVNIKQFSKNFLFILGQRTFARKLFPIMKNLKSILRNSLMDLNLEYLIRIYTPEQEPDLEAFAVLKQKNPSY